MWVMITGITRIEDALEARDRGADALGLLVDPADACKVGFISPEVATFITQRISCTSKSSPSFRIKAQQEYQSRSFSPPMDGSNALSRSPGRTGRSCESVLVTHLVDVQEIIRLASFIGVTTIQLVGNTTPEDVIDIKNRLPGIKIIKAVGVVDDSCMEYVKKYMCVADAIELDTIDIATDQIGGTGKTHDWNISKRIVQEYEYRVPIILAGGLHSDNVEKAIQTVKPFGVDVSSGVKDGSSVQNEKLASLISRAKHSTCGRT